MHLLIVYGQDMSEFIDHKNYNVNSEPVYEEWTDANYTLHRDKVRTRVEGSFSIGFTRAADFERFCRLLEMAKNNDETYKIMLYVNDINRIIPVSVFIDAPALRIRDVKNDRSWNTFTVKVKEA